MKTQFFIFKIATTFPHVLMDIVNGSDTGRALTFNTYEEAEKWIEEQRKISDYYVYQIQKFYV
jgi:hypothetical protein